MIVVPDIFSLARLAEMIAISGALDGAKVHLYQNSYTPQRGDTVANYTTADFSGYAASAVIAWGTPYSDPVNGPQVVGDSKQFTSSGGSFVGNTIYGVYVTDTAGTGLLYAEQFVDENGAPAPVIIAAAGQAIVYVPVFGAVSQAA